MPTEFTLSMSSSRNVYPFFTKSDYGTSRRGLEHEYLKDVGFVP